MDFVYPWPSEINFKPYIEDQRDITGRKWLFDKLEVAILNSTYGVLLTAEMGYGKTAIMSYLSCISDTLSAGYWIRKNMVSFHMCRFDALVTLKPDIFIKNIAGSIANRIPEYGNTLLKDRIAMDYIQSFRCSEDPLGCFDRVVLYPASKLQHTSSELIIAIDGIDECLEYESGRPNIVKILATKVIKMRKTFKLLVTSRNLNNIEADLRMLNKINLLTSDIHNKRDVEEFLDEKLENSLLKVLYQSKYRSSLHEKLMEVSEGNFLFVKELLNTEDPSINSLPESLQQLYYLNFDRVFGEDYQLFDIIKPIIEVMVASYTPLDINTLIDIANETKLNATFIRRCLYGKLGHLFKNENGSVMFHHKAMSDFLLRESENKKYSISKEKGHLRISEFLMQSNSNIIDAMQHIIDSKSEKMKNVFIIHGKLIIHKNNFTIGKIRSDNIVHKIARSVDSYEVTKLLLEITGCKDIDVFTLTNVTATFLASAFGNYNTLRALYECGADLRFTRHAPPIVRDEMLHVSHIEFCKHYAFWGYNSLHIASQHGHKRVVEFILQKSPDLLSSKNSMDLNSFQLAVEFGHTETADFLLQKKSSFSDLHSLYYAAKNKHIELVRHLLSSGVSDVCLPCNGSVYWVKGNQSRYQSNFQICDNFTFQDDYRLLRCETALEAAVQSGNIDIVRMILNQSQDTIHCRHFTGRSPILTAVQFGRFEIFKLLLSAGANIFDTCQHKQNISSNEFQMSKEELELFIEEMNECPLYASVGHLAAMFGREEVLISLPYNLLTSRDSTNATPMHYAVCHKHSGAVGILISNRVSTVLQSSNGSTTVHSGAICGSFIVLSVLEEKEEYFQQAFNILDYENRSFMHHLFLLNSTENSELVTARSNPLNYEMTYFLKKSQYTVRFIDLADKFNRTYLHYAALLGQFDPFYVLLNNVGHTFRDGRFLCTKFGNVDSYNSTSVDLLFSSLPFCHSVKLHIDCPINLLFDSSYNVNRLSILSPHEQCLWVIIEHCHKDEHLFSVAKIQRYIKQAIKQNSINSIVLLQTYVRTRVEIAIQNILPWILQNVLELDKTGIMVPLFFSKHFEFCDRKFEESILHKVMYNEQNKLWVHSPIYNHSALKTFISTAMNNCFDRDGYNILHRAVIGGNAGAVDFLLHKKLSLNIQTKTGQDIISLFLEKTPFFNREHLFISSFYNAIHQIWNDDTILFQRVYAYDVRYSKSFDAVGKILIENHDIKEMLTAQSRLYKCLDDSQTLSKIHFFAAKGLRSFMEYSATKYGKNVLECANRQNFTPFYFAMIFGHDDTVIKFLNESNIKVVYPERNAEIVFLLDALTNFFDSDLTDYIESICEADNKIDIFHYSKKVRHYLKKSYEKTELNTTFGLVFTTYIGIMEVFLETSTLVLDNEYVSVENFRNNTIHYISLIHKFIFERKFNFIRKRTLLKHDSIKVHRDRLFFRLKELIGFDNQTIETDLYCKKSKRYKYIRFLDRHEKNFISGNEKITLWQLIRQDKENFDDVFYSLKTKITHKFDIVKRFGLSLEDFALHEINKIY